MKMLTRGICLVVFCLPLYLIRFEVFSIPTTVLEIMIYALFIFWLLNKLIRNTSYQIRATKQLFFPIFLILIGITLSTIFSSDLHTSAGIWKAWFVDPLLFFVVLISIIKTQKQIKSVLCSLFLSGGVVSVISLVYLIQGNLDPIGRLQAFYNSPNYLAMYLAPAFLIGIWFLLKRYTGVPNGFQKIYYPVFILLIFIILIFTKSYGAWMGIIAAIGIGIFICLLKSKKKLAWIILACAIISILILGYLAITYRSSSFESRLIIWEKSWQVFKTSPILGIGPGTLENYFLIYPEWEVPQPHNIFIAFLLQTGIIGFIGFIWLLFKVVEAGLRSKPGFDRVGLWVVLIYILVHGLVDTLYWKNDLAVVFWLIVGLAIILKKPQ